MTDRKINLTLKRIAKCKAQGYHIEGLILNYQLNIDLLTFLVKSVCPTCPVQDKKTKAIVNMLLDQFEVDGAVQGVITKRSLKIVKDWFDKMDLFFKMLKLGRLLKSDSLQLHAEQIFGILNISANKLFAKNKR